MIKLKDILLEVLSKNEIMDIVNKVYPKIVKDLGGQAKPVEVHPSIWDRIGAVAADDLKREQGNPDAQYDPDDDIIYLYSEVTNTEEKIIRSLLHEHTHTLQDQAKLKQYYDEGAIYQNHPFEIEARKAEKNWKKYL
jgi:hypothetical protein|tara:strand:- start:544 stop:954 length:411 start_codon:yes stop_codon:yes gene_type:complete